MTERFLSNQSICVLIHKKLGRGGIYFLADLRLHFGEGGMYFVAEIAEEGGKDGWRFG